MSIKSQILVDVGRLVGTACRFQNEKVEPKVINYEMTSKLRCGNCQLPQQLNKSQCCTYTVYMYIVIEQLHVVSGLQKLTLHLFTGCVLL